mmetsp:Transcript_25638/g.42183  ORF Transcript_25638/g.42183 Transcript_25638/m.42183 type:complete len:313 (-) Transcript_25638:52-990(-)
MKIAKILCFCCGISTRRRSEEEIITSKPVSNYDTIPKENDLASSNTVPYAVRVLREKAGVFRNIGDTVRDSTEPTFVRDINNTLQKRSFTNVVRAYVAASSSPIQKQILHEFPDTMVDHEFLSTLRAVLITEGFTPELYSACWVQSIQCPNRSCADIFNTSWRPVATSPGSTNVHVMFHEGGCRSLKREDLESAVTSTVRPCRVFVLIQTVRILKDCSIDICDEKKEDQDAVDVVRKMRISLDECLRQTQALIGALPSITLPYAIATGLLISFENSDVSFICPGDSCVVATGATHRKLSLAVQQASSPRSEH